MLNAVQSDINFQPKTQGFAFSTENEQKKSSKKIIFFSNIFLAFFLPIILFVVFLLTLNYFKIISLSAVSPVFNKLPGSSVATNQDLKQYNIPGTNQYIIDGVFQEYTKDTIKIKYAKQTISFKYDDESRLFVSTSSLNNNINKASSSGEKEISDFFSNIFNKENLGKKVSVQYNEEKKGKIIQYITIYK